MNVVGTDCTDIMVDENGQPVADIVGEFKTVSNDECWRQDLRLEANTEQGELFYEDADGDESYGFGMLDFINTENDDFAVMEIQQRVSNKLAKRTYIDKAKTKQVVTFENGKFIDNVSVSKQDSNCEYNIELSAEKVEVESE